MKTTPTAALGFIFITALIDMIGFGLIFPVLPKLIEQFTHGDISTAAQYGGWLTLAYAVVQFVAAPVLGNLSDRYGRRPVLLAAVLGFGIDYAFLAFAQGMEWLFIGRIIAGITGASYTVATAYIADISTPENRSKNFGLINGAFSVGFMIGPVIGGMLSQYGVRVPFLAASALSLLNAAYGYFVLPESLKPENRRKFEWRRANPVGSLKHLRKFPPVAGMIVALLLLNIAGHSMESVWSFFTIAKFRWNEAQIGYSLGFMGLMFGLSQAGLGRIVLTWLGDRKSVVIGIALYTVSLSLLAFASQGWMMYAFMIPYALGAISNPALQGLLSNSIPDDEQGELQGGLTSLMSLAAIIGPPLMTTIFSWFAAKDAPVYFPGAPFLLAGILTLLSALLAIRSFRKH